MQPPFDTPRKRTAALLVAAFALFAANRRARVSHASLPRRSRSLFEYRQFESAIAQSASLPRRSAPRRLGLGRLADLLRPRPRRRQAQAAGPLRFLNGGVPGTTPRCWPFFVRAIDPQARRFAAVVIAVDTYGDDDSAIGSLDGDDRPMDLRYVVFQTRLTDLPKLAGSFSDPRERVENGIDLFWRGRPNCATTFRRSRRSARACGERSNAARNSPAYDPLAAHPRSESFAGLRVDFATNTIVYPPGTTDNARSRDRDASARGREAEPSRTRATGSSGWRRSSRATPPRNAGLFRAHSDASRAPLAVATSQRFAASKSPQNDRRAP